ncbi:MAG: HIT family protein [Chloroflexi bacterium]|nr:HIT family protein [Chloroflexota bacterium]
MRQMTPEEYDEIARSDCFVCRLVAGNPLVADPRIVYEDEHVIAFLNQFPTQEGYTLVCPKRHAERWESDLDDMEWMHLQSVVRAVARGRRGDWGNARVCRLVGEPGTQPACAYACVPLPTGHALRSAAICRYGF